MTYRYHFSGWFTTNAYASIETTEPLTEDEINNYLRDNLYDLNWEWGHKGEIISPEMAEVEVQDD